MLIVGSFGLASNILGLFLFHDHGHSHGGHSHGHGDSVHAAEEGHAHSHSEDHAVADERGNVADVLPQNRLGAWPTNGANGAETSGKRTTDISWSSNKNAAPRQSAAGKRISKKHHRSRSRGYSGPEDIPVYPSSFRNSIIESSRMSEESGDDADNENAIAENGPTEQSPLLPKSKAASDQSGTPKKDCHTDHKHNKPKEETKGGHGHSHDLNMRGVFLHVLGDALGNIGVIASALIIWLTDYSWRHYSDPAISLVITVIILGSAIPLCRAAARILLQAVPAGLSIDDIKDDITELDGIVSCHHVHVWQLSDTKLVASLHVQVAFDFKGNGSARYMALAREIRQCLHEYGIHSSTIQPEFCLDENHDHTGNTDESSADEASPSSSSNKGDKIGSKTGSVCGEGEACLLECSDACGNSKQCCEPAA